MLRIDIVVQFINV